ncbi:hypothetical protein R6Q59_016508 [Mikania micrantha]
MFEILNLFFKQEAALQSDHHSSLRLLLFNLGRNDLVQFVKLIQKVGMYRIQIVQEHNHPRILLLQIGNTFCKLPGSQLKLLLIVLTEVEGLKRKLSSKLASNSPNMRNNWQGHT